MWLSSGSLKVALGFHLPTAGSLCLMAEPNHCSLQKFVMRRCQYSTPHRARAPHLLGGDSDSPNDHLFKLSMHEITNRMLSFEEVLGPPGARLQKRVGDAEDPKAKIALLQTALTHLLQQNEQE